MRKIYLSLSILLMFSGNCTIDLIAQPGTLDNTFGTGGKVTISLGPHDMYGESVLVQPDGKIVVAGTYYGSDNDDFTVVRYNSNGTLDNTFSGDGVETTNFSFYSSDYVNTAALQPDGKIILAGYANNGGITNIGIARYTSAGLLDNAFSGDGKANFKVNPSNGKEIIYDIVLQPDGKIVAVGYSDNDMFIIRLNSDGSYDTTFNGKNGKGWITIDIAGDVDIAKSVALQSDGKIVVSGQGDFYDTSSAIAIVRLKTDGTLDSTFSSDGKTTVKVANGGSYTGGVAIQTDGRIVIAGTCIVGKYLQCALIRLNNDGTLDNTFSGDGMLNNKISSIPFGRDQFNDLLVQPDGKILATGSAEYSLALVRYNSDGSLDTSFNSTGITRLSFDGSTYQYGSSVALQPDYKIVVAGGAMNGGGGSYYSMAVARYFSGLPSSSVTDNFITDTRLYPNPANDILHLEYKLSVRGSVSIQLIDMMGRNVLIVADNKTMEAGPQTGTIDLQSLPKGIYTLVIRIHNSQQSYLVVNN